MIYLRNMGSNARRAALLAIAIAIVAFGRPAFADERVECAKAYESAQRLQQKSQLVGAFEAAERCARPTCPALLRDECVEWTTSIRQKTPQLVARVKASDGCHRTDAKIDAAGPRRLENGVLYVDPGVHEITIVDPVSRRSKTETIDFAAGEKRDIDVDFATPGAQCEAATGSTPALLEKKPISTVTLVLGSVGAGLVLAGATFGVIGAVKRGDLDDCKATGGCEQDRIDGVRTFFIAGDILAGVGILALTAAAISYFVQPAKPASFR